MAEGLQGLHSSKSSIRLNQIAQLRASGIGNHVDLPQLVVAGDQSAGKSSVLEGITGIPFPRQDGVCTKFPTEIILQRSLDTQKIVATVIPCSSRSAASKVALQNYRRPLESFAELGEAIAEVGSLMGIKGFGDIIEGPAFCEDVLRIEVSGPSCLHLTVVDLPGLIKVANEEQTDQDVQAVQSLVDLYTSSPRSIILAVVQAGNDIANQAIIQKARQYDVAGERTVGIITKPDLINEGTEKRIALLAKNKDTTKLNLGYFIVKNPTPAEIERGISLTERQSNETRYFQSSPWKEQDLDAERVGVVSLRTFLQHLLDRHIERELPKVRRDLENLMAKTEQDILSLGDERPTTGHHRMFLCRLSMQFHKLSTSALIGTYHETDLSFFAEKPQVYPSRRLRASVHRLNTAFSDCMRENGEKRKITDALPGDSEDPKGDSALPTDQILVTRAQMKSWVKEVYASTKGKELSGNYNHMLLTEMFHVQSSRWHDVASAHLTMVYDEIVAFVEAALKHISGDERVLVELLEITTSSLLYNKQAAEEELYKIYNDEKRQPQTYNHYYTDTIQNARLESTRNMLKNAMEGASNQDWNGRLHINNNSVDSHKLLTSLQNRITINMDEQACEEALAGLKAYYKVARKTFVDNVCRQVIERHLLCPLPAIFSPEIVSAWDEDLLERVASEDPGNAEKRKRLQALLKGLKSGLAELRR